MNSVLFILREITYFLTGTLLLAVLGYGAARAWVVREEHTSYVADEMAKVLEAESDKPLEVREKLYHKYAHTDKEMRFARQLTLAGETGDRNEQTRILKSIREELRCTTPELQEALGESALRRSDTFSECNSYNSKIVKGWLGYLHATSYPAQLDTKVAGCLRDFQVKPRFGWLSPHNPTLVYLEQSAKASGRASFHYEITAEYYAKGWTLLTLNSDATDKKHFFYSADPATHAPVAAWGANGQADDELRLLTWLKKEATGIPESLAKCWASSVVSERI